MRNPSPYLCSAKSFPTELSLRTLDLWVLPGFVASTAKNLQWASQIPLNMRKLFRKKKHIRNHKPLGANLNKERMILSLVEKYFLVVHWSLDLYVDSVDCPNNTFHVGNLLEFTLHLKQELLPSFQLFSKSTKCDSLHQDLQESKWNHCTGCRVQWPRSEWIGSQRIDWCEGHLPLHSENPLWRNIAAPWGLGR